MQNKLAHTAEHAFIGSLQKLIGKTLNVQKVEHRDYNNLVVIRSTDLGMDTIIKAEYEVNSLISQGRRIIIHTFGSLAEAKSQLPNLRANETRIEINKQIRVVEIEDHDLAACVMDHATNLRECVLFLVTRMNKIGSNCEINFVVSDAAKNIAVDFSQKILNICAETGANYDTIEETVKKLRQNNRAYLEKLRKLTEQILGNIESKSTYNTGPGIINGAFLGLLDEQVREFASRKIREPNLVLVLANLNSESDSMANVVFARSESLSSIDCDKIFTETVSEWGKGGGKCDFVTGVVKRENVRELISTIVRKLATK